MNSFFSHRFSFLCGVQATGNGYTQILQYLWILTNVFVTSAFVSSALYSIPVCRNKKDVILQTMFLNLLHRDPVWLRVKPLWSTERMLYSPSDMKKIAFLYISIHYLLYQFHFIHLFIFWDVVNQWPIGYRLVLQMHNSMSITRTMIYKAFTVIRITLTLTHVTRLIF